MKIKIPKDVAQELIVLLECYQEAREVACYGTINRERLYLSWGPHGDIAIEEPSIEKVKE